jgi:hypothetical protein
MLRIGPEAFPTRRQVLFLTPGPGSTFPTPRELKPGWGACRVVSRVVGRVVAGPAAIFRSSRKISRFSARFQARFAQRCYYVM